MTRPARRSTSAPARRTSAARGCVAGVGIYKSTNGGETWTGPLGDGPTLAGKGVGKIVSSPAARTRSTPARRPRSAACRRVVLRGRHPAGSGRGQVGPLQVHERRRDVELHPQRLRERCRLHRIDSPSSTTRPRARRAASGRRARPVEPGHPLRVVVCTRHLALDQRRSDVDADQAVAERGDHPDAADDRRHDPANGKTRMYVYEGTRRRRPVLAALPERRRVDGRAGVHRPDQPEPAVPGFATFNLCDRRSAGTTCSSTRRRAIPTSSTSAARTRTARRSRTSARSSSRRTPA